MRLHSTYIKQGMYTCSAIAFLVSVHLISVYFFAVHRFAISYDPQFAPQTQTAITAYINNYPTYSLNFKKLEQSLQQTFACIASLQATPHPQGIINIHINAHKPLYVLNDTQVVTTHNTIITAHYYHPEIVQTLPTVSVVLQDNQKQLPQQMFAYLSTLHSYNLPKMSVHCKHPHDIHLLLQEDNLKLKCNAYTTPPKELLQQCREIAQQHSKTCLLPKKILADIRFDNLIIVSKIKKLGEML